MGDLKGTTVIVTGGARGIGAETGRQLIERGANVALVDLRGDEVEATAERLGERALPFTADVRDQRALEAIAEEVEARFGSIDAVVANAGIAQLETFAASDPANFERTIEVNLLGPWRTARATLPQLRRSRGYLLVVASVAAALHGPMMSAYCASKAGVEALADSIRVELAADGIDVGVAYFPWIDTAMVRDTFADGVGAKLWTRWRFPLDRVVAVEKAGAVMSDGIERRARRIYTPRWVRGALIARAAIPRLLEREVRRARIDELVRELDATEAGPEAPTPRS